MSRQFLVSDLNSHFSGSNGRRPTFDDIIRALLGADGPDQDDEAPIIVYRDPRARNALLVLVVGYFAGRWLFATFGDSLPTFLLLVLR